MKLNSEQKLKLSAKIRLFQNYNKTNIKSPFLIIDDVINEIEQLEKQNENMLNALIEQNKRIEKICKHVKNELTGLLSDIYFENIDLIEKIKNKSWEEICEYILTK